MRQAKVTEVSGKEVTTDTAGGFVLAHTPGKEEFAYGDVLEITNDLQKPGYEIIRNVRTGREVSLPSAEP